MRIHLLSCFLFTVVATAAQSPNTLTLLERADLGYRALAIENNRPNLETQFNNAEEVAILPAVELRYHRAITPRHGLRIGASYSLMGFDRKAAAYRLGCQWNGTEYDPSIECGEDEFDVVSGYRFHYLTVPVAYTYRLFSRERGVTFDLAAGLAPGYLMKSKTKIYHAKWYTNTRSPRRTLYSVQFRDNHGGHA